MRQRQEANNRAKADQTRLIQQQFDKWYEKEKSRKEMTGWLLALPDCPCELPKCKELVCRLISQGGFIIGLRFDWIETDDFCTPPGWSFTLKKPTAKHHPGGEYDVREEGKGGKPGQQCIYDKDGKLITESPGAGTPDFASVAGVIGVLDHISADVSPYELALVLDGNPDVPNPNGKYLQKYMEVRPPNKGKNRRTGEQCPKNPK
jgi:hypothetical protein